MKTPFRGFTAILYKEFLVALRDPFTLFLMFFPAMVEMVGGHGRLPGMKFSLHLIIQGLP